MSIIVTARRTGYVLAISAAAIVLAACGSSRTATVTETTTVAANTTPATPPTANTPPAGSEADLTTAQKNALRAAQNYLEISAFSKQGLIDQLSSSAGDGYSVTDATAAVNTLEVNWNEQAASAAKKYLDISPFSCSGLVQQLSSSAGDKFTPAEAEYGAEQAGVCSPTTTAAATTPSTGAATTPSTTAQSTPNSGFTDCGGGVEAGVGTTSCRLCPERVLRVLQGFAATSVPGLQSRHWEGVPNAVRRRINGDMHRGNERGSALPDERRARVHGGRRERLRQLSRCRAARSSLRASYYPPSTPGSGVLGAGGANRALWLAL